MEGNKEEKGGYKERRTHKQREGSQQGSYLHEQEPQSTAAVYWRQRAYIKAFSPQDLLTTSTTSPWMPPAPASPLSPFYPRKELFVLLLGR